MYTQEQLRCLMYYEGDVEKEDPTDPFWSDSKAYVTLNALLFEGIETEMARSKEGRYLNPAIATNPKRFVTVVENIFSLMRRAEKDIFVRRVERKVDLHVFEKTGKAQSFLSCSYAGFLDTYTDKEDVVLMDITVHSGCYCVDLAQVLPNYLKGEEQELLIGPYQKMEIKEFCVPNCYTHIRDCHGHSPYAYVKADIYPEFLWKTLSKDISLPNCPKHLEKVYRCLNEHQFCPDFFVDSYLVYKEQLQNYIIERMKKQL